MKRKTWHKVVFNRWLPSGEDIAIDLKAMKTWLNENVQVKRIDVFL